MDRVILHSDMNHFYAAVEEMRYPQLRDVPMAVGGSVDDRHGIILTKNDLAKKYKIKTGEALWQARQKCPGLVIVPPHYDLYVKYSRLAREIYGRYTDLVEPYGMDECWLDVTGSTGIKGSGERIANEIRETIREELGLTVSVGVSFNKILAKLGSDMKKPDAVTVLDREHWQERVWPLAVSALLYVGWSTTRKLTQAGIYTIGDLAQTDPMMLKHWFGKRGLDLSVMARGDDRSRVMPQGFSAEAKSVGHGITCNADLTTGEDVWRVMLELSQDIGRRLCLYGQCATGVELWVRKSTLDGMGYQKKLPFRTQSPLEIAQAARQLFETNYDWSEAVRQVTVRAINLVREDSPTQLSLFSDEERRARRGLLERSVIDIRRRFGDHAVRAACLLGDLHMPSDGRDEVVMPGMMYR